ncbi:hypothetical protein HPP92_026969 [Vanilla planifolia]|uniref:Cucumisin n=1 Tax=Vanilla planifolia TaxID=51239 RepID=A0A835U8P1_VANPL|nr:hypothetical protein HPP92_026969 [Vanilla planifolia]
MALRFISLISCLLLFRASLMDVALSQKAYVVYLGDGLTDLDEGSVKSLHSSLLGQVVTSEIGAAAERLIHSYTKSFNGFAALLSEEEAEALSEMNEVVSVFPSERRELHTTRSWNFMGFPTTSYRSVFESDVVIGMLDTGIWPESDSFDDTGFAPPPARWRGACEANHNFTCNNKVIGARFYHLNGNISDDNIASPRDSDGHGTHTASTAAGRLVPNASLAGLAEGTARGGVPSARLAVYKVCWDGEGCSDIDLLAAFDDAIADGVDVISLSIGSPISRPYFSDAIAIGSFHATKQGILVSSSAGNNGPSRSTVANFAPWMLTVAASTIDRKFVSFVELGDGHVFQGTAINTDGADGKLYPLIYGANAPNKSSPGSASRFCSSGSLDGQRSKGKVIFCDSLSTGSGPLRAGAVAAIMETDDSNDVAYEFDLPVSVLSANDSAIVRRYINSTSHPTARVFKSKGLFDGEAPYVVSFSSRGPNPVTPNILKPDLTAPGVDILAAWSPISVDKSSVTYNIISGTSMACPHVSGLAAYVKSFHPKWSPAAIKSALITTAFTMSTTKNADAEFAYGAGHVNPLSAINPGLVYDVETSDYVKFLCGQGYTAGELRKVTGDSSQCTEKNNGTVLHLNYPTFALSVPRGKQFSVTYHRTVTNVGVAKSTYAVNMTTPLGVEISVDPAVLSFEEVLEKKSFVVKVWGKMKNDSVSAALVWTDGIHKVRSPIVVYPSD